MYGRDHVVKVTVNKTKGQKRTSPVTSHSPGQKAEKKRSTTNANETSRRWGDIFTQQNLLHMTKEEQSSKHGEDRKAEKNINATTKKQNTIKHSVSFIYYIHLIHTHIYIYIHTCIYDYIYIYIYMLLV